VKTLGKIDDLYKFCTEQGIIKEPMKSVPKPKKGKRMTIAEGVAKKSSGHGWSLSPGWWKIP